MNLELVTSVELRRACTSIPAKAQEELGPTPRPPTTDLANAAHGANLSDVEPRSCTLRMMQMQHSRAMPRRLVVFYVCYCVPARIVRSGRDGAQPFLYRRHSSNGAYSSGLRNLPALCVARQRRNNMPCCNA